MINGRMWILYCRCLAKRDPCEQPERVMARSVLSYWAVRELGISGTSVGERLGLSQSAVSRAVQRGERFVSERHLSLKDE